MGSRYSTEPIRLAYGAAKNAITGEGYFIDLDGTIVTVDGMPRNVSKNHAILAERRATVAGKRVGYRKATKDECKRLWK